MKFSYLYTTALAAAMLCGISSCNDDDWSLPADDESGVMVDVALPISTQPLTTVTRQAITPQAEARYDDLWIFFFKENGTRQTLVHRSQRQDTIHITIPTGNYYIYAVANLTSNKERGSLSHEITNVNDLKTLKEVVANQDLETVFRNSGHLLMSGIYDDGNPATPEGLATINLTNKTLKPLYLQRLDAKITFNVGLDPNSPELDGVKFETLAWKVCNVAGSSRLFPDEYETPTRHFSMQDSLFFENDTISATTGLASSTFTFYSLPNSMRGTGATKWADREKRKANSFLNAPENSTYVLLSGYYSHQYVDSLGVPCTQRGKVRYTIHLGYLGDDCYNNYEVKRNTHYTYNVLVQGINDIIVKVDEDPDDPNDGNDGDIINARYVFDLDCHYDREILCFNKDSMALHPNLKGFYVKTPFEEGFFNVEGETLAPYAQSADLSKDYDWIKFRRNNITTAQLYSQATYAPYHPDEVIDVKELIKELHNGVDKDNNSIYDLEGNVVYTMFIDENYYSRDPSTGFIAPQDFWKKFVNKEPREMYILCDYKQSKDLLSSISSAYIQLRQRSIRTIYNTEIGSELKTAWGVETLNETGALQTMTLNPWEDVNDQNNCIANQSKVLDMVGKAWNSFLTYNYAQNDNDRNQLALSSEYDPFVFAMIQRNRDLNGDGKIDIEELKWYPAASNQYLSLWIGHSSVPNETRLYPNGSRDYRHYLSSDGREFLAEEGGTSDKYAKNIGNKEGAYTGKKPDSRYDYRCVRMLGFSDEDYKAQATPQPFAVVNTTTKQVDLKYLDANSRRPADFLYDEEMEVTAAESYLNFPYTTFEYADVDVSMPYYAWDVLTANIDTDASQSPCASLNTAGQKGWRLPNEREMNILISFVDDGWDCDKTTTPSYYLTRTYGASYLTNKRSSIYMGVSEKVNGNCLRYMTLPTAKTDVRVRCIRDVH